MTNLSQADTWIAYRRPNLQARLRLFCFPYAGGSASVFRAWQEDLPTYIEVCPIQYPGRENRLREQLFTRVSSLVGGLEQGLRPYLDMPFAFFGHSLGGLLSYELARKLHGGQGSSPFQLFISGCRAPHRPGPDRPIYALPDHAFVSELRRLNGTPEPVLQNVELMQFLLPILRADFEAVYTYQYTSGLAVDCPIVVFGGLADHEIDESDLAAWRACTRGNFSLRMFPGDHFFLHSARQFLLQAVIQSLDLTGVSHLSHSSGSQGFDLRERH